MMKRGTNTYKIEANGGIEMEGEKLGHIRGPLWSSSDKLKLKKAEKRKRKRLVVIKDLM